MHTGTQCKIEVCLDTACLDKISNHSSNKPTRSTTRSTIMKKKVRKVNLNELCFRTGYQQMCKWKHAYIIWPARPGWIFDSIRSIAQGSTSHNTLLVTDRSSGFLKETSQTTGEDSKHLRCKQMQGTWNKRWDSDRYLVFGASLSSVRANKWWKNHITWLHIARTEQSSG